MSLHFRNGLGFSRATVQTYFAFRNFSWQVIKNDNFYMNFQPQPVFIRLFYERFLVEHSENSEDMKLTNSISEIVKVGFSNGLMLWP